MAQTYFFYDLETSGINPRSSRIMQFAGQRTDTNLQSVGDPVNLLIKLSPDVLPDPEAIMLTGIAPQQTLTDGITEAAFEKIFFTDVAARDTMFVGFNNIRFDDEFMRFLHFRNFRDPYEWEWADGNSRWDMLDVIRMARALRPDGITWPYDATGKPTNRLELLTQENKLDHYKAHDAMSDVHATIAVAHLLQTKQPDFYNYLLSMRDKKQVAKLVGSGDPFVYTTSHFPSEFLHTSVVVTIIENPRADGAIVYDLRHDPTPFFDMSVDELVNAWKYTRDPEVLRLPVKTLKYNRCPAVAPLGVFTGAGSEERLNLSIDTVKKHLKLLNQGKQAFADKLLKAVRRLDEQQDIKQTLETGSSLNVDERLYENFISNQDKKLMREMVTMSPDSITDFVAKFQDERLRLLLPLFKARNFPDSLDPDERVAWDAYCKDQLYGGGESSKLAMFFSKLKELADQNPNEKRQFILEELQLYGQSLLPADIS